MIANLATHIIRHEEDTSMTVKILLLLFSMVNRIDSQRSSAKLRWRRVAGTLACVIFNQHGFCMSCYMPWRITKPHIVDAETEVGSIFSICEWCHKHSTADEHYRYCLMRLGSLIAVGYRPKYGREEGHNRVVNLDAVAIRKAVYGEAHQPVPETETMEAA